MACQFIHLLCATSPVNRWTCNIYKLPKCVTLIQVVIMMPTFFHHTISLPLFLLYFFLVFHTLLYIAYIRCPVCFGIGLFRVLLGVDLLHMTLWPWMSRSILGPTLYKLWPIRHQNLFQTHGLPCSTSQKLLPPQTYFKGIIKSQINYCDFELVSCIFFLSKTRLWKIIQENTTNVWKWKIFFVI